MTGHFEARKHAYRQTQDGIVVSFVIHPNDINSDFAVAPLGTHYMIAFAKIGGDGKPVAESSSSQGQHPSPAGDAPKGVSSANSTKRKFHELPLSQQSGIRCNDPAFQDWLVETHGVPTDLMGKDDAVFDMVRRICGVKSRSEFNGGGVAAELWIALDTRFLAETGRQTEQRG